VRQADHNGFAKSRRALLLVVLLFFLLLLLWRLGDRLGLDNLGVGRHALHAGRTLAEAHQRCSAADCASGAGKRSAEPAGELVMQGGLREARRELQQADDIQHERKWAHSGNEVEWTRSGAS